MKFLARKPDQAKFTGFLRFEFLFQCKIPLPVLSIICIIYIKNSARSIADGANAFRLVSMSFFMETSYREFLIIQFRAQLVLFSPA